MKMTVLSLVILLFSCTGKKEYAAHQFDKAIPTTGCPKEGTCEIKTITGKTLILKTTESGDLYYELGDDKDKTVIIYSYTKTLPEKIQDAAYREEIVFEITKDMRSSMVSDSALEQAKMLFGRFCYCKGSTGYYKVKNGSLGIAVGKTTAEFNLRFKIGEVPQVLRNIGFTLK